MTTCSVIIPARNVAPYIEAALRSVALQNRDDIEVIVVDDGSTDETLAIISRLMPEMAYVRVVKGEGLGPGEARNLGISEACGDLIAFLDADDLWWAGKLDAQIMLHVSCPDVVLSATNFRYVSEAGEDLGDCFTYHEKVVARLFRQGGVKAGFQQVQSPLVPLLKCNIIGTSTVMVRKSALQNAKGFANCLSSSEEWELWLRLADYGPFAFRTDVAADYLMRQGSETARKRDRLNANREILSTYLDHNSAKVRRAARAGLRETAIAEAETLRLEEDYCGSAKVYGLIFLRRWEKRYLREALKSLWLAVKAEKKQDEQPENGREEEAEKAPNTPQNEDKTER